jgi:hypothetical protein
MFLRRTRARPPARAEPADATLAARMSRRDGAAFVGRAVELQLVSEGFADDAPISVLLVHGPAGIGKSAFLREVERRGRQSGWTEFSVAWRDLTSVPTALGQIVSQARSVERPLVLIDDYERMGSVGHQLRRELLPSLPARAIVALAGRQPPEAEWFEGGWDTLVFEVALGPLSTHESLALLERRGVAPGRRAKEIAKWAGGVPLALRLAADAARADPGWWPRYGPAPIPSAAIAPDLAGAVREALRSLELPHALAQSPLASGQGIAQRAASVRALILEAEKHAFGETADERLLNRVLVRGYLDPASSHEQAAAELHLSRSTYFRRLKAASDRVADYVATQLELRIAAEWRGRASR